MSKQVLSLEAFADWCEKQPDAYYDWASAPICACGQYAKHLGITKNWMDEKLYSPSSLFWRQANNIAAEYPHTFSGLAQRLHRAIPVE